MADDPFGLTDSDYWDDPFRTKARVEDPLFENRVETIRIGAPKRVDVDARDSLPLLALQTGYERSTWPGLRGAGVVAAYRLEDDRLFSGPCVVQEYLAPEVSAPETSPTAFGSDCSVIDLRQMTGLPWQAGTYCVVVTMRDRRSNPVEVTLVSGKSPSAFEDGKTETSSLPVWPPEGRVLPTYENQPGSPTVPQETRIALEAPRITVLSEKTQCILRGSFRLPIRPGQMVKPPPLPLTDSGQAYLGPIRRHPNVMVPIHLLLTGTREPGPVTVRLNIPSYMGIESNGEGGAVRGYFSLDLCTLVDLVSVPQTYFLYALSGRVIEEPVALSFVHPSQLED